MRHFLAQLQQRGLADQVCGDLFFVQVRDLLRVELGFADGQEGCQQRQQVGETVAARGGQVDGVRLTRDPRLVRLPTRVQRRGRDQVYFVETQHERSPKRQERRDALVVLGRVGGRVHQPEHRVHPVQRVARFLV